MRILLNFFIIFMPIIAEAGCLVDTIALIQKSIALRGKVYGLHLTLAKSKNIQIYGSPYHALKMENFARGVLQRTERFDQVLFKLGFSIPKHTTIYINKGVIKAGLGGPHYITDRVFNIWNGKINDVIVLDEWGRKNNLLLKSKSILQHERMHSILHTTYNREAFTSNYSVIQEAFADFTTSFLHNDPKVAFNFFENNYALRNLKEQKFSTGAYGPSVREMKSILDFNGNSHNNSILFSNVLWEIYEKIGKNKMEKMLKPILDDLNDFYESYLALRKTHPDIHISESDYVIFDYFLSSLDNTIKKFPEIENDVRKILQSKAMQGSRDIKKYELLRKLLKPSGIDYTEKYSSKVANAAKISLIALPTEAGVIYVTYTAYDKIKNLFFTDKK